MNYKFKINDKTILYDVVTKIKIIRQDFNLFLALSINKVRENYRIQINIAKGITEIYSYPVMLDSAYLYNYDDQRIANILKTNTVNSLQDCRDSSEIDFVQKYIPTNDTVCHIKEQLIILYGV